MSGKYESSKPLPKGAKVAMLAVAAAVVLIFGISIRFFLQGDQTIPLTPSTPSIQSDQPTDPVFQPIDLGQGLILTEYAPYTGSYVEDGSNELVSDVMMILLENTGSKALQYARISLEFPQDTANFSVTNIPAGGRVVLLEENRMAYREELPTSGLVSNLVLLPELPMYADIFEITADKGVLTVTNISDTVVTGDIYIYYKNSAQDIFYGGITYRAKLTGGLTPGQSKQVGAGHYLPTGSTILMVSYNG